MSYLRYFALFFILLFWGLSFQTSRAQVTPYTFDVDSFPKQIKERLDKFKSPYAQEFGKRFYEYWNQGILKFSDKRKAIDQVNRLNNRKWLLYPDITTYLSAFMTTRHPLSKVSIDPQDFFNVTDSVVKYFEKDKAKDYLNFLQTFVPEAIVYESSGFAWKISQREPRLVFKEPSDLDAQGITDMFPALQFTNTDLIFQSKGRDSVRTAIKSTKGYFNLTNRDFRGEGGRYDWSRVGLSPDEVYCEVPKYSLNLSIVDFKIDSVVFYYRGLLDKPLKGTLQEHIAATRDTARAVFPYFQSSEGGLVIRNFIENVTYKGGFSLRGNTKIGSKVETRYVDDKGIERYKMQPAILEISNRKKQACVKLETDEVNLNPKQMLTDKSRVTIYLPGGDSLYHQSMKLSYDVKSQDMAMLMDRNDRSSWQPILNSYSKFGMYFDAVRWNPNEDTLYFTAVIDQQHKMFAVESYDFYRKDRYWQYQGVLPANPIGILYRFYIDYNQTREEKKLREEQRKKRQAELDKQNDEGWNDPEDGDWGDEKPKDPKDLNAKKDPKTKPDREDDPWGDSEEEDDQQDDGWEEDPGTYDDEEEDDDWDSGNDKNRNPKKTTNPQNDPVVNKDPGFDPFAEMRAKAAASAKGRKRKRTFKLDELLKYYKLTDKKAAFEYAMVDLKGAGFIEYDPKTRQITISEQLISWARSAKNLKDHDQISIVSKVNTGNNATMDFATKKMELIGVQNFTLSDSQMVEVQPLKNKVFLEKNRDLDFSGVVNAGKLTFVSNIISCDRYHFDYNEFKIRGDSIDYVRFFPKRGYFDGKKTPRGLVEALQKLKIENVTGALYIDEPRNKSSRRPRSHYPAFDCYTLSYVYWQDSMKSNKHRDMVAVEKNRQTQWLKSYRTPKSYTRDSLKFTLDPFLIDSLESFDLRYLEFYGGFQAVGILPDFRDTLKPVADNTYGIRETFPGAGVPLYGGKGKFFKTMTMDGFALHGNGQINYLATEAKADTFVFNFDSVMAITSSFYQPSGVYNGVKFPEIKSDQVEYTWYPYEDRLVLNTYKEPLKLFEGQAEFLGAVIVTPKGIRGAGTLNIGTVSIESDYINFDEHQLKVEDGTFRVTDPDIPTKQHFVARKCSVNYAVKTQNAEFFSTEGSQANGSFPNQRYKTSLGRGTYNKATGEITLRSQSMHAENNFFESTDPNRGGLKFLADSSYYSMKDEKVVVLGVDSILVADAVIYPDSDYVLIQNDGSIDKLRGATIVANTGLRYHTFKDANVYIVSKQKYNGNADHAYVPIDGKDQKIFFPDIRVGDDSVTIARGMVREDDGFFISERILYKDSVIIRANDKYMSFKGQVKIQSNNPALRESWFEFNENNVNPDTVVVTISDKVIGGKALGVNFWDDRIVYYSSFIEKTKNPKDLKILEATGVLTFDPKSNEFRIGPREKIEGKSYAGNVVSYDDSLRIVTSRGAYNWNYHQLSDPLLKNPFSWKVAGSFRNSQESKTIRTDWTFAINLPDEMKEIMTIYGAKVIEQSASEEDMLIPENRLLLESAAEFIPETDPAKKEAAMNKFVNEVIPKARKVSEMNLAKDLNQSLVLSGVKMAFCDTAKAFYTYSPKIGLVGMQGKSINKQLNNCKMELRIGKRLPNNDFRSDTLRIFLSINEFEWVYYELADFKLKVLSSNPDFNKRVLELAEKKSKKKKDETKKEFEIAVAEPREKEIFIEKVFPQYLFSNCGLD